MTIVFFGSGEFAVTPLRLLMRTGHHIACVVTQPDRHSGRGLALHHTPVKTVALEEGVPLFQPPHINDPDAPSFLKGQGADLFVVIAYGQLLSQAVLAVPKLLALNLHASLLPKYRGAAPINWALIRGEEVTGVTVMKMVREMDAGPILMQKEMRIGDNDTFARLQEKLSDCGAHLLLDALAGVAAGTVTLAPQDSRLVTFAPKLKKRDGLICWKESAVAIHHLMRGCLEWPGAYSHYRGKVMKLFKAKVAKSAAGVKGGEPGEVLRIAHDGISVATGSGCLIIEELQPEGKRRMSASEFIAGHRLKVGDVLGG